MARDRHERREPWIGTRGQLACAADICVAEERADEMRWALECGDVTRTPIGLRDHPPLGYVTRMMHPCR
jgi:hypothetical protein